jgi:UDPglucose 6-dehydrogenase/GDP-mannose 6-dehydrogenase
LYIVNTTEELADKCDCIFICVGTPSSGDGSIDLSFTLSALTKLSTHLQKDKFTTIIIKSTVLPSTTDTIFQNTIESNSGLKLGEFGLAMNPEFLREGSAIDDSLNPDRIVIGTDDAKSHEKLSNLFKPWTCQKIFVNSRTAEMIKYSNNTLLALQISASNQLANLARKIGGINYSEVIKGIIEDRRWNTKSTDSNFPSIISYLKPGPGFGGSCFPKDIKALLSKAKALNVNAELLESILNVNNFQHLEIVKILEQKKVLSPSNSVLILGLSFKENTDDIRESKSLDLIYELKDKVRIYIHDPKVQFKSLTSLQQLSNINFVKNWNNKIKECSATILMTVWDTYKHLEKGDIMNTIFLDSRGFYSNKSIGECKNYISLIDNA